MGDGEVTSSWSFAGPDLSGESVATNKSYTFKTLVKAGLCSGDDAVSSGVIDSMQSGGLIIGSGGVGSCSHGVASDGNNASKSCVYYFDKSAMDATVGYSATDGIQRLCEVAQLQWNGMVIAEQYVNIEVTFDRTGTFEVENVAMSAATIKSSDASTSLAGYITGATCDSITSLSPNQELCVKISSSSSDVLIESIDVMTMTGPEVTTGSGTLNVIEEKNTPKYAAITSIDTLPAQYLDVKTMVPTNLFNFEATDAKLNISGTVTVKFQGRRHLIALDRLLQANEAADEAESAEFSLNVNLAPGPDAALEDGDDAMMNSAKATAGKAFATLGMVFASAFALW